MATLAVQCRACGCAAIATLADRVLSVNAGAGIHIDDACPRCAGELAAPAGRYLLDDSAAVLRRVGNFEPDHPHGIRIHETPRPPAHGRHVARA